MPTGRSALPVFGLWVAWVYLLSLIVIRPAGDVPLAPLRPEVRFLDADTTFDYDVAAGPNGLRGLQAELSQAFDRPIEIPVTVSPVETVPHGTEHARAGVDYAADRDAVIFFPANSTRGTLRERDALLDVAVTPDAGAAARRRFRLQLDGTEDVVVAADPQGLRLIDIPAGAEPRAAGIKARFRDLLVDVDEADLPGHRFIIEADQPPDEQAELLLSLYRRSGAGAVPVLHFTGTFPAGVREQGIRLNDLVSAEDLRRIGAAYDPRPGVDEWYEVHLDARPPLVSSSDPCFTTIFSRDQDASTAATFRFEDESGTPIRRVVPKEPFWVVAELSQPIEVDCHVTPFVNGTELTPGGLIPAGTRRSDRLGPYRLEADPAPESDEVSVGVRLDADDGSGACLSCGGRPGGCKACRAACKACGGKPEGCPSCRSRCQACGGPPGSCSACRSDCGACGGRPGGCALCRPACKACGGKAEGCPECRGACKRCGGRDGGCAACGFGTGVCGGCGGKPGECGVCGGGGGAGGGGGGSGGGGSGGGGSGGGGSGGGGSGGGGSGGGGSGGGGSGGGGSGGGGSGGGGSGGGGSGGGGSGGGGSGKSPVAPPPSTSLPKGPAVPGDFMIFLVNNQRLHEPGDVITDRVREAIKDRKPYAQGAIVINDEGKESVLDAKSPPPAVEQAFAPFSADQQDLEGQAARVVDTIVRKRRNAENPDIRTLVVWPEREFVSARTLEVFKTLANDGRGPISFLCPDADPERARELAAALQVDGGAGEITVRSPKSEELVEHIDDVLDVIGAKPTDRLNVEEAVQ